MTHIRAPCLSLSVDCAHTAFLARVSQESQIPSSSKLPCSSLHRDPECHSAGEAAAVGQDFPVVQTEARGPGTRSAYTCFWEEKARSMEIHALGSYLAGRLLSLQATTTAEDQRTVPKSSWVAGM